MKGSPSDELQERDGAVILCGKHVPYWAIFLFIATSFFFGGATLGMFSVLAVGIGYCIGRPTGSSSNNYKPVSRSQIRTINDYPKPAKSC